MTISTKTVLVGFFVLTMMFGMKMMSDATQPQVQQITSTTMVDIDQS